MSHGDRYMKIIPFILVFIIISSLCSCDNRDTFSKENSVEIVVYPDEETAYTINGYKDTSNVSSEEIASENEYTGKYFGNTSTKKYHLETCRYAKSMDEKKLKLFDDTLDAQIEGYTPCLICNK